MPHFAATVQRTVAVLSRDPHGEIDEANFVDASRLVSEWKRDSCQSIYNARDSISGKWLVIITIELSIIACPVASTKIAHVCKQASGGHGAFLTVLLIVDEMYRQLLKCNAFEKV